MTKLQKAVVARLLLLAALWLSGCSFFSAPIDISGFWQGQIQWTTGPATGFVSPISLDLVHDGRELSGTITLAGPSATSFDLTITEGRARTVSMSLEASGVLAITPPQTVTLELEGDFLETRMSGTGSQTINGTTYELTWEATLVAPAVPPE